VPFRNLPFALAQMEKPSLKLKSDMSLSLYLILYWLDVKSAHLVEIFRSARKTIILKLSRCKRQMHIQIVRGKTHLFQAIDQSAEGSRKS